MWMQYGAWLSQPREIGIFTRPRILLREITGHLPYCLHYTYVENQFLNNKSILNILDRNDNQNRLKALVGILNSRLMSFFCKKQAVKSGRTLFPKVVIKDLGCFPVPEALGAKNTSELVRKVESMLEAKGQLMKAKTDKDKNYLINKCASLDRQIDLIVYNLYGLSKEDIRLVEAEEDQS
jgi:adenine-specific DNA-methyltransferase